MLPSLTDQSISYDRISPSYFSYVECSRIMCTIVSFQIPRQHFWTATFLDKIDTGSLGRVGGLHFSPLLTWQFLLEQKCQISSFGSIRVIPNWTSKVHSSQFIVGFILKIALTYFRHKARFPILNSPKSKVHSSYRYSHTKITMQNVPCQIFLK